MFTTLKRKLVVWLLICKCIPQIYIYLFGKPNKSVRKYIDVFIYYEDLLYFDKIFKCLL